MFFREAINCELLIEEVKKRPALYNPNIKQHNDKCIREKLWTEVCEATVDHWNELSEEEKDEKGKLVRRRWKSLRECFRRDMLIQKGRATGSLANKKRKYLYFEQLTFLTDTMEERRLCNHNTSGVAEGIPEGLYEGMECQWPDEGNESDYNDDSEGAASSVSVIKEELPPESYSSELLRPTAAVSSTDSPSPLRSKQEKVYHSELLRPTVSTTDPPPPVRLQEKKPVKLEKSYEEQHLSLFLKEKSFIDDIDEDKTFLMSLVPGFKRLSDAQKFDVKIEILKVMKAATQASDAASSSS